MNVGILAVAAYVPRYRLPVSALAEVHGRRHGSGERSVASYDEDSLTLAAEAIAALPSPAPLGALLFASSTPPLLQHDVAPVLAAVLDAPPGVFTADVTGGGRAGLAALRLGMELADHDVARRVLVACGECWRTAPGSVLEQVVSDAGGAWLLGPADEAAAVVEAWCTVTQNIMDVWRLPDEAFPRRADLPFLSECGYVPAMTSCLRAALKEVGGAASTVARFLLTGPDRRASARAVVAVGGAAEQLDDRPASFVGDMGSVMPAAQLALALETAAPGERIVLGAYGSGIADAVVLRVTDRMAAARAARLVSRWIARRAVLGYERFLKFKRVLGEEPLHPFSSPAVAWRNQGHLAALKGSLCRSCGQASFPPLRVCRGCGAVDDVEERPLARVGRVLTYAEDYLYPNPDPPTVMAVAALEDGLRFYGQLVEYEPGTAFSGLPVELVLRRLHEGGGFPNYFWKLRPLGAGAVEDQR